MIIKESPMGWYQRSQTAQVNPRPTAEAEFLMEIIGEGQSVTGKVFELTNLPRYADLQIFARSYPKHIHNIRHRRIRKEAYRIHHRWKANRRLTNKGS
jgi:hypothetical protein